MTSESLESSVAKESGRPTFVVREGRTYIIIDGADSEFGDFVLKLLGKLTSENDDGNEGKWVVSCGYLSRNEVLDNRIFVLPSSAFDSKIKFLNYMRTRYGGGSFALGGSITNGDLISYYNFLKEDLQKSSSERTFYQAKHMGHQFANYWNNKLVPQSRHQYLGENNVAEFSTQLDAAVLQEEHLKTVCRRYLELSQNFGINKVPFQLATAFVVLTGIRAMLKSVGSELAGENSIGLLYSKDRNVGKTLSLTLLSRAQGIVSKGHPLFCCGGDQTCSGTSLKILMHALESSTLTTLVDDPVMNKCLAEFLLQVQSGLPQGSIKTGLKSPVGSLLMSSNSKECERIYGRVLRFDFKKDDNLKTDNEAKLEMDMKLLVKENKGFLVAWPMRYISFWVNRNGNQSKALSVLRTILCRVVPEQQARWHKAATLLIYTYIMFHLTADVEPNISEVIRHLTETNSVIKPGPFWIRFQNQLAVKLRKQEEPVLTWLNPQVNVKNQNDDWVPAIGIISSVIDAFPGITRQETREELEKVSKPDETPSQTAAENFEVPRKTKRTLTYDQPDTCQDPKPQEPSDPPFVQDAITRQMKVPTDSIAAPAPIRKRLFAEGTIGILPRESASEGIINIAFDNPNPIISNIAKKMICKTRNDDLCHQCKCTSPPKVNSNNTKKWSWVQCDTCKHWFHLHCTGLTSLPKRRDKWNCSNDCKAN